MDRADHMMRVYRCEASQPSDFLKGGTISFRYKLSYFDALIIAVAARAGATLLLTEDMQDGLEVGGLRLVNPFMAGNAALIDAALDQRA